MPIENALGIAHRGAGFCAPSALRAIAPAGLVLALACSSFAGCKEHGASSDVLAGTLPRTATFATAPERVTDAVIAAPGDAWNTELTTIIEPGGGIEWDLGEIRPLTHALIAADHDDFYALLASNDGATWKQVWEASPVAAGGQQRRATSSLNASGRFVRLEGRGGDGAYSVSELALGSHPTSDWPPRFTEKRGKRRRDHERTPVREPGAVAFVLAVAALFSELLRRKRAILAAGSIDWRMVSIVGGLAALFAVTALAYCAEYRFRVIDDSYISFQYAKNLASGNGLVFNPGERVEGFTNFLWVLLLTPFWWIAHGDPEVFTRWTFAVTIALGVVALALMAGIGRALFKNNWLPAVFALLLFAFDDSFVAYAILGLENHLLVVTMLLGLWFATAKPRNWEILLGVSFALVAMTRPDGMLWVVTYFTANAASWIPRWKGPDSASPASLLRTGGAFVVLFGAYFAWRYSYYGYPLPNTFYLKVGSSLAGVSRGLEYLTSFVTDRYGVPLIALASAWSFAATWVRWLLPHALVHAAYIVYVGGDFYPGHRFLFALIPTLALLAAVPVDRFSLASLRRKRAAPGPFVINGLAVLACVAVRTGTILDGAYPREVRQWANKVDNNVRYMQWLDTVRRDRASMVIGDIGAAGFFANVHVFDVFGIVDPKVAHKPSEGFGKGKAGHEKTASPKELLAGKPTYIKWGYLDARLVPKDYYIFNAFPPSILIEGLWVKDDNDRGRALQDTAFHLDRRELRSWTQTGNAFDAAGSDRAARGQRGIRGQVGGFVNSFTNQLGDRATGRLLSPEFALKGERMRLLVGGGRDPERLRVSLIVDGKAVFSETGTNFETLGRREWNIAALAGKSARIEILDQAQGTWGHILVDEIAQWTFARPAKL